MQKGWGLFDLETVLASVSLAMGIPRPDVGVGGGLYSEVQYIGNGHMGPPVDRQIHTCGNITFPQLFRRAVNPNVNVPSFSLYDSGCEYYSGNKRFLNIVKTLPLSPFITHTE